MSAGWRAQMDRFWAAELGVSVAALERPGLAIYTRADAEPRVTILGTTTATVVSVPDSGRDLFENAGFRFDRLEANARAALTVYGEHATLDVRGPAYLGVWSGAPRLAVGVAQRIVSPMPTAVAELRDIAPAEWHEAGFGPESIVFGAEVEGGLVAVAGYERWDVIAHLQVFSHPRFRRRGFAAAVLTAAIRHAVGAGLLPQYRARDGNQASRALADALGFEEYGWMATIWRRGEEATRTRAR